MAFFTIPILIILIFAAISPLAYVADSNVEEAPATARALRKALLVRLALILLFETVPQTRVFHEDATGPEWLAPALAGYWAHNRPEPTLDVTLRAGTNKGSSKGYYYVAAALCFIFGEHRVVPALANAIFGVATCAVIYRLARLLYGRSVARSVLPYVSFFPSFILWSTVATKEALVMLLVSIVVLALVSAVRDADALLLWWAVAFLGIIAVFFIRSYIADLLGSAYLLTAFQRPSRSLAANIAVQAFWCCVALAFFYVAFPAVFAELDFVTSIQRTLAVRESLSKEARSGYAHEFDLSNIALLPFLLPVAIAYFLYSPFPWHLVSARVWFAVPETIIWWRLAPFVYRGLKYAIRRDYVTTGPLMTFVATLTIGYSLMHGNVGSAYRQRTTVVMFLLIFACLGKELSKRKTAAAKGAQMHIAAATTVNI